MTSALERLADRIRYRRKLLGMSQEALAERTGLSLSLLRRIERKSANPTLTNLEKIADVLGEDIADLFNGHAMQDTNKLKKHLILTELSQLSLNQLLLIRKLIKSFQKDDEDKYLDTSLGKIYLKINLKDNPRNSAQKEEEDEYLATTLGKIPLKTNPKGNPPISSKKS